MIDYGTLRWMLPTCDVGAQVNLARRQLRPLPGEPDEDFADRSERKLRQTTQKNQCLTYQTCASCPVGARLIAEQKAREYSAQPHHIDALVAIMGAEGPNRALPLICSIGEQMRSLISMNTDGARLAISAINDEYACSTLPSCLTCPTGLNVFDGALQDLCDNGMDGETGRLIREKYSYLW